MVLCLADRLPDQRKESKRNPLLVHDQDRAESDLVVDHLLYSFLDVVLEVELFNHALDAILLGELDGFFAILRVSTRPSMH